MSKTWFELSFGWSCVVLVGGLPLKVKLWSLVMYSEHAMSLRHDGLDLDMSHVSSLEVRFWVFGHRVTYILWV